MGFFWHEWASLKAHECQKEPNLHTNELNTFFCSTSPLKAPNRLKSLKLAWRFVLTSYDIYQNPLTQEKNSQILTMSNKNSSLFNEFVCKLAFFFWHESASLKREWNDLHKNELNTTFFCLASPLKALNRLKFLKLAWRFVLTSCQIYQNPFTQEKILKFWQCRTKKLN
jgi:hypothetical protein